MSALPLPFALRNPRSPKLTLDEQQTRNITFSLDQQRSRTMPSGMSPPVLHVQRPSDDSDSLFNIDNNSDGKEADDSRWHCCKCDKSTPIHIRAGPHPLGALACECPHKPCGSCKTVGLVKLFLPMEEPAIVPVSEVKKNIPFGVLCPCCGLSWRAKETGRYKSTLRKMPSLGLSMAQTHQKRRAQMNGCLRRSKSTLVLANKRIITPPGQAMGKQAEYAKVKFSELGCTCGMVIDLSSALCFQVVRPLVDEHEKRLREVYAEESKVGWSTTPELQAMGHGQTLVSVGGIEHANPLRSCPITKEDVSVVKYIRVVCG